jgi:uncharacterized protein YjeT (DUF2065 family)
MKKKHLLSLIYILLALGFAINGLIMLLAPDLWLKSMPLGLYLTDSTDYLVRALGLADLAMSPSVCLVCPQSEKAQAGSFCLEHFCSGFCPAEWRQDCAGSAGVPVRFLSGCR